jgi:hypothetical protein
MGLLCRVVFGCWCGVGQCTGTLDSVRGLFKLTELYLNANMIGGMSACTTFNVVMIVTECVDWFFSATRYVDD